VWGGQYDERVHVKADEPRRQDPIAIGPISKPEYYFVQLENEAHVPLSRPLALPAEPSRTSASEAVAITPVSSGDSRGGAKGCHENNLLQFTFEPTGSSAAPAGAQR